MEEESAERTQCRVSDDDWRGAAYAIEKGSKLVSAVIDNSVARLDEGGKVRRCTSVAFCPGYDDVYD